ncbi:DNA-primase RepB domain-containing protein [Candidatus Protochlamydia sp. W-9]|uniref:DNA-primase RepB domain-containing protein n=1 Tax=Candidatus Protochlamydia sp. W-9 TaxID=1785087 RepID=UPI00096AA76D|nr:DNA-primase RepB domain-containing protein [Candidatus Protochlamydia sp. W-9]
MSKEPQLAIALQFLNAFDEEGIYTFQTFDDSKTLKRPYLTRVLHGNLQDRSSELIHLNSQGAGIFFTVNATDGKGRSASHIIKVRAVFVDLDGDPLEPILNSPLEPHFIIQSSPNKYHVYWLVEGISIEKFTSIQKLLSTYFQGDEKVCDIGLGNYVEISSLPS